MAKRIIKFDANLAAAFLLGIGTCLLLLICLSTPITEASQLFRLLATIEGVQREVEFGLWGYCILPIAWEESEVVQGCSGPTLGLEIDSNILKALHADPSLLGILHKQLTWSFVLYPIATALTFLTCVLQLGLYLSKKRPFLIDAKSGRTLTRSFIFGSAAMFTALIASALQIFIVGKAKLCVTSYRTMYDDIFLYWGNLVWLTVVGTIIHFANLILLFAMRLNVAKADHDEHKAERRQYLKRINEISDHDLINPPLPRTLPPPR
ncbi:hypothetical protein FA15DRAFT_699883 [Coprinopsis marcescibilis]|uniref:Uncharacterized protein n=1 Tax=Coprinopsis marcescibilis TaxID=230819 RepID=A0A5C3LCD3_COPMA|nr:hypothetical protein FA15DRAFT_699883 [Coprinopsis marcescibilis]